MIIMRLGIQKFIQDDAKFSEDTTALESALWEAKSILKHSSCDCGECKPENSFPLFLGRLNLHLQLATLLAIKNAKFT